MKRFRESEKSKLRLLFDLLLYHLPLPEGAGALQRRQLLVEDPVQHLHVDRALRVVPGFRLAALEQLRNLAKFVECRYEGSNRTLRKRAGLRETWLLQYSQPLNNTIILRTRHFHASLRGVEDLPRGSGHRVGGLLVEGNGVLDWVG